MRDTRRAVPEAAFGRHGGAMDRKRCGCGAMRQSDRYRNGGGVRVVPAGGLECALRSVFYGRPLRRAGRGAGRYGAAATGSQLWDYSANGAMK